jgi:hypothetical protein
MWLLPSSSLGCSCKARYDSPFTRITSTNITVNNNNITNSWHLLEQNLPSSRRSVPSLISAECQLEKSRTKCCSKVSKNTSKDNCHSPTHTRMAAAKLKSINMHNNHHSRLSSNLWQTLHIVNLTTNI